MWWAAVSVHLLPTRPLAIHLHYPVCVFRSTSLFFFLFSARQCCIHVHGCSCFDPVCNPVFEFIYLFSFLLLLLLRWFVFMCLSDLEQSWTSLNSVQFTSPPPGSALFGLFFCICVFLLFSHFFGINSRIPWLRCSETKTVWSIDMTSLRLIIVCHAKPYY